MYNTHTSHFIRNLLIHVFTPLVCRKAFYNMLNHISSNSSFHCCQPGTGIWDLDGWRSSGVPIKVSIADCFSIFWFIYPYAVKPDPPVNVKVVALPGKKLHVQWAPPPTWPDTVTFPLKYKVQFQWGNPNTTNIVSRTLLHMLTSPHKKIKPCRFILVLTSL